MLGNFSYYNPTKIYFGKNSLDNLTTELSKVGNNILLVYGKGSIKKNGIYDEITTILKSNNKTITEISNVMPNPTIDKVNEGCIKARETHADLILAVGGGSVCDYAKAVSACTYCNGDPWEKYYIQYKPLENKKIPVGCILTMVGTGSEMNSISVVTNPQQKLKIGANFGFEAYPEFSILNPLYTYSLPKYQMVSGFFDIMSHLLEQYFSGEDDNTSDYIIEGLLKSLIHSSRIAIINPKDYEARSNIMWTATLALNSLVNKGKSEDWMVHMIGHAISAYTNATHGMTLSAVSIPYYRYLIKYGLPKFKRYAINVWNVNPQGKTDLEIANEGLDKMQDFMKEIDVVLSIKELGVTEDMLEGIANVTPILKGGYKILTHEELIYILKESL